MNKITNKYFKEGNLHQNCSVAKCALLKSKVSVKHEKSKLICTLKSIVYYPHTKNTGFDLSVFEHILRIVSTYCLLRNQWFYTPNCILKQFLSCTQQSQISILHRMTFFILSSNLLLKQNIDHSHNLVREIFNPQIILLYNYSITSLGK